MARTWDDTVTLISVVTYEEDDLGQQLAKEEEIEVCCCREQVSRSEFYLAGQNDIEVSEVLIVHPYEYNRERFVGFQGRRLKVVKTYQISTEELELTCTERIEK